MEMRSKNSKPIDPLERAYMADVKRLPCRVCGAAPPSIAHHVKQGAHFTTVSVCEYCHVQPHGIHGDKSRWRVAKMTELLAINSTVRGVIELRSGQQVHPRRNIISVPAPKRKGSSLSSDKILKWPLLA